MRLIKPDLQHLLCRFSGGLQGAEVTLQAALSPRLSACVHTLFTCLLFSLFSCCLPREPAALARGTCQACVYRTRSRYPSTCQLAPPMELVVECAQSSFHPPVLRVGDWRIILCRLAGLRAGGGGRGGRVSSQAGGDNSLVLCTELVEKRASFP